jgi:hypothetical protein
MLLVFPAVVAAMLISAAFMPTETEKKEPEKDPRMYLICDTVGDNCHWIRKERICEPSK